MAKKFTYTCEKFLGLNYNRSKNSILAGESPDMQNFTVTPSYTLEKRRGYSVLSRKSSRGRGIWCGMLSDKECVVYVSGKEVFYRCEGEERALGELESEDGIVSFLCWFDSLYLLDGVKIKVLKDGVLSDIEPYRPLVAVSTTPDGAGVSFEGKNLLTGKMRQSFTMNGTSTTLRLALSELDSIDYVKMGESYLSSTQYTKDIQKGTVTLLQSYADYNLIDGVEVGFTKEDGLEKLVHSMRFAQVYGGKNDTRIFLYGDRDNPDTLRYSAVYNGKSSMEYFCENDFNKIPDGSPITSTARHFDRLMIFCPGSAYNAWVEEKSDENGLEYSIFPMTVLSDSVGCECEDFVRLANNFPITLDRGTLYRWRSSSIRDERYSEDIGERVKSQLGELLPDTVRSFESERTDELFIYSGDTLYVYNYRLDLFYLWRGVPSAGFATLSDGRVLFVRHDGSLCSLFDSDTDDGEEIKAFWTTPYLDLADGVKNLYGAHVNISSYIDTAFDLSWVSDHGESGRESFRENYRRFSFEKLNFLRFGFNTSLSGRRIPLRVKHKRFEKLSLRIENSYKDSPLHIFSFALKGIVTDKK